MVKSVEPRMGSYSSSFSSLSLKKLGVTIRIKHQLLTIHLYVDFLFASNNHDKTWYKITMYAYILRELKVVSSILSRQHHMIAPFLQDFIYQLVPFKLGGLYMF